jgi:hypothetical protein
MIFCEHGNVGKSTIASLDLCELFGNGIDLPPCNDAEKLVQAACDICIAKEIRGLSPIFVDLPRAINKYRLNGIYTAIEQIKKGKLYDLCYHYKEYWIHAPQIWVLSNILPKLDMLSKDRWKVWTINEDKDLEPFNCKTYRYQYEKDMDKDVCPAGVRGAQPLVLRTCVWYFGITHARPPPASTHAHTHARTHMYAHTRSTFNLTFKVCARKGNLLILHITCLDRSR